MADLIPFDEKGLPRPFGLNNTGVICHFNALLQGLATCTAFTQTVAANRDYMAKTPTGSALYNYVRAVQSSAADPTFQVDMSHSGRVLAALIGDLRHRRPRFQFGNGMESATEGLVLLLDMVEPPSEKASSVEEEGADAAASEGQRTNPIARLFHIRIRDRVWCRACSKGSLRSDLDAPGAAGIVSTRHDMLYQFNYFHYDLRKQQAEKDAAATGVPMQESPKDFASGLLARLDPLIDYTCEQCTGAGRKTTRDQVYRLYEMRRMPTILVVIFNQYVNHTKRYFPKRIRIEGVLAGGDLTYRQVAQIEHSGSLHGGHYWARGVRQSRALPVAGADPPPASAHVLNDGTTAPNVLGPEASVYTVIYHFDGFGE
jgi:hypothetical protein